MIIPSRCRRFYPLTSVVSLTIPLVTSDFARVIEPLSRLTRRGRVDLPMDADKAFSSRLVCPENLRFLAGSDPAFNIGQYPAAVGQRCRGIVRACFNQPPGGVGVSNRPLFRI